MSVLPKVLATSVVRSTHQSESHGGIYLIDLASGDHELVKDWNDPDINWEGRGADRGLRGIAFYRRSVLIAASDELFVYDQDFNMMDSYRNPYVRHCHEIHLSEDMLWLTSTGLDGVLGFDLIKGRFAVGYQLLTVYPSRFARKMRRFARYSVRAFDPDRSEGASFGDSIHLNNVWVHEGSVLVSGTQLRHVLKVRDARVRTFARVPRGTHNAQPFRGGILANHTASNRIAFMSHAGHIRTSFPIKTYPENELTHSSLPPDHARQAFGRGLCTWNERVVIGGSSPATVSAFDFDTGDVLACVNITKDVRNAIHGLEVWPF